MSRSESGVATTRVGNNGEIGITESSHLLGGVGVVTLLLLGGQFLLSHVDGLLKITGLSNVEEAGVLSQSSVSTHSGVDTGTAFPNPNGVELVGTLGLISDEVRTPSASTPREGVVVSGSNGVNDVLLLPLEIRTCGANSGKLLGIEHATGLSALQGLVTHGLSNLLSLPSVGTLVPESVSILNGRFTEEILLGSVATTSDAHGTLGESGNDRIGADNTSAVVTLHGSGDGITEVFLLTIGEILGVVTVRARLGVEDGFVLGMILGGNVVGQLLGTLDVAVEQNQIVFVRGSLLGFQGSTESTATDDETGNLEGFDVFLNHQLEATGHGLGRLGWKLDDLTVFGLGNQVNASAVGGIPVDLVDLVGSVLIGSVKTTTEGAVSCEVCRFGAILSVFGGEMCHDLELTLANLAGVFQFRR